LAFGYDIQVDTFKAGKPLTEEEFNSGVTENKGGNNDKEKIIQSTFFHFERFIYFLNAQLLWTIGHGNIKKVVTSDSVMEIKTPIKTETSNGRMDSFATSYQAISVCETTHFDWHLSYLVV
jgi:hypothetical protein